MADKKFSQLTVSAPGLGVKVPFLDVDAAEVKIGYLHDLLYGAGNKLGQIVARMAAGEAVKIACYGDSTTDGNGTTGFVYNRDTGTILPSALPGVGSDVGQSDHTAEVPYAWPAVLQTFLRDMFRNQTLEVWNAGYSGQLLSNGWAYANYENAVILNPYYGSPDLCFIGFGWNDVAASGTAQDAFRTELEKLVRKIMSYGGLPILLTPTAAARQNQDNDLSIAERENEEIRRNIIPTIESVASRYNLPVIDVYSAMTDFFTHNEDAWHWELVQPDELHYGDLGHAHQAGYIAAKLFPDIVWAGERTERIFWQDSRSGFAMKEEDVWIGGDNTYSRNPNVWNISATDYVAGQAVFDAWVFVKERNPLLIYRSFTSVTTSTNVRTVLDADLPRIKVQHALSYASTIYDQPVPCSGDLSISHATDRPFRLCRLRSGLNRVRLLCPTGATLFTMYGGFFEINPRWIDGSLAAPFDFDVMDVSSARDYLPYWQANALRETGPISLAVTHDGSDANVHYLVRAFREAADGQNCYSLSKVGDKVEVLFDALMPTSCGLVFGSGRAHDSDFTAKSSERSLFFYFSSGLYAIYELGDPGNFNALKSITGAHPFPAEGSRFRVKILVELEQTSLRNYRVRVYHGHDSAKTLLLEFNSGTDLHPTYGDTKIPGGVCGVAGGFFINLGVGATKDVDILSCVVRHYGL